MIKIFIYLKNGLVIDFHSNKLLRTRNSITGEVTSIEWENIEGELSLFHLDFTDISAVTYQEVNHETEN